MYLKTKVENRIPSSLKLAGLVVCLFLFIVPMAKASMIDINLAYLSDTMTTSSTVMTTRTNYDVALGVHLNSKKNYYIALTAGSLSTVDQATATTTFTSQDTGVKVGAVFGKSKNWALSVAYNFIGKASYKVGAAAAVELRGTSLRADLGYNMWVGDSWAPAFKILYYAPTFTESVSGTTITNINYTRATIIPGINFYLEY